METWEKIGTSILTPPAEDLQAILASGLDPGGEKSRGFLRNGLDALIELMDWDIEELIPDD